MLGSNTRCNSFSTGKKALTTEGLSDQTETGDKGLRWDMNKPLLLAVFGASLFACAAVAAPNGVPQDLIKTARESLSSVQDQSFANNREYCGMIGRTTAGELIVSAARRGRTGGCDHRGFVDKTITPVASYHTHGGFEPDYDSEVPSVDDIDMDYHNRVFGFVATPGGRFWLVDYRSRTVTQLCGVGCLPKDPTFRAGMAGPIPKSLTRREVAQRKGKGGPRHLRFDNLLAEN